MAEFEIVSDYVPTGDQPAAISKLTEGVRNGLPHQVLLGVTGSGKTFTVANVLKNLQVPTLIISHNKTLAAQLFQEFREFFPKNAVEYFVSYYDYYQPEAYIPHRDLYIEKEADINDLIDKLRLSATASLISRNDVIVVASVSCIYNIGSPVEYGRSIIELKTNNTNFSQLDLISALIDLRYDRSDYDFKRSTFRVLGDTVDVWPSYTDAALRIQFGVDGIEKIFELEAISGRELNLLESAMIFPAKHFMTSKEVYDKALTEIQADLEKQYAFLRSQNKDLEAHRLKQRTEFDLEMIREIGFCPGIENYSRYFDGRSPGDAPFTLLDYFKNIGEKTGRPWLCVIDESHITVPQIRGMYAGDRARKETLVDYGFRLPSAIDNRPLRFDEFMARVDKTIYTSATPAPWEINESQNAVTEQLIRPTGLLDPEIEIRPIKNQVDDLIKEIEQRVSSHERVLVTTLTKRMAEELSKFLEEHGIKVHYLHADVETLRRSEILSDLRKGVYDVIVGINLLREGLDLPEVSLVAILDADKEGFLRSETSLIQTMGRAARHLSGKVIMYADNMTGSMQRAIDEVDRRRKIQFEYNQKYGITPQTISKPIRDRLVDFEEKAEREEMSSTLDMFEKMPPDEQQKIIDDLELKMTQAARDLNFEKAAEFRDMIIEMKKTLH